MGTTPERPLRRTAAVTRAGASSVARCLEAAVASPGPTVEAALANLPERAAIASCATRTGGW